MAKKSKKAPKQSVGSPYEFGRIIDELHKENFFRAETCNYLDTY